MALPALASMALLVVVAAPTGLIGPGYIAPDVMMVSVFYWTSFRPQAVPFWTVFLLGLFQDALFGTYLGLTSLLLILLRLLTISFRLTVVGESFMASWLGFALLSAAITLSHWLMASSFAHEIIPVQAITLHWGVTFFSYPLFHLIFTAIYGLLPRLPGTSSKPKRLF